MSQNIIHNMVKVMYNNYDHYSLYWASESGQDMQHICNVYGFENAVRVANGIAHEQVEFVQHPPFKSEYEEAAA